MTAVADVVELPPDEPPRKGAWAAEEHPPPTDEEVDVGERVGRISRG